MGDFHTAVALIVATDTEETAVRHMYEWTQRTFAEDGQPYYEACFSRGSEEHRVVYARQGEMGMVAAAVLTTKLIGRYSPRYVIMVGIAAGIAKPDMAEQIYGMSMWRIWCGTTLWASLCPWNVRIFNTAVWDSSPAPL